MEVNVQETESTGQLPSLETTESVNTEVLGNGYHNDLPKDAIILVVGDLVSMPTGQHKSKREKLTRKE